MAWNFEDLLKLERRAAGSARFFMTPRGAGPPILFVHGGFHGAWCWTNYLSFFAAQGMTAAALDLRGHGGLPQSSAFVTAGMAEMAEDVAAAAAALGGDVILGGHSLGALAAMAAARAVRPRALIMLAPAAPGNMAAPPLPPFAQGQAVAPPPENRARKWFLQGAPQDWPIAPYLERLCAESPAFLNDGYRGGVTVDPAWVAGPALCVSGALDASPFHPAGADAAVAALYGATHVTLDASGHGIMFEPAWQAGAAVVHEWIAAHDCPP